MAIEVGKSLEKRFQVKMENTAKVMGSGSLEVLATPMLICFMENTAADLLGSFLNEEVTSVGSAISMNHLAPTPVGSEVKITATIVACEKERLITFELLAEDPSGQIGEGTHHRVVVKKESFMTKTMERKTSF